MPWINSREAKIISHGWILWTFGLLVMIVRIILLLLTQVSPKINVLDGKKTNALLCNIFRLSIDVKIRIKNLFFSADFSAKNRFSVGLETILGRKN